MSKAKKVLGIVFCMVALSMMVFAAVAQAGDYAGVLEEKDGALVLMTADASFVLAGEVSKELVGKKVVVTGAEDKDAQGNAVINVEKVEEAAN